MIANRIRLARQAFAASVLKHDRTSAVKMADIERKNTEMLQKLKSTASETQELKNETRKFKTEAQKFKTEAQKTEATALKLQAENARLEKENGRLRTENAGLKKETQRLRAVQAAQAAATPRTYRVKRGDTLSSIAESIYGDGSRWPEIKKANRKLLGRSDKVKPNQVLVIP
jgi:nucleoid-associated protein YgaU